MSEEERELFALPEPLPRVVDGDGIQLRLYDAASVEVVAALVERSRASLSAFLPWAIEPTSPESRRDYQVAADAKWAEGLLASWMIVEDGQICGMLGGHRRGGPDELELGYWLDDHATGRGLMTRACAAATDAAFRVPSIDVVLIVHDVANHRSEAVPRRLGFARTSARTSQPDGLAGTGIKVRWTIRRAAWVGRRADSTR